MVVAFQVHPGDNVATLLDDADAGVELRGAGTGELALRQPVAGGHKVALADLAAGAPIVKFGVPIGTASGAIARGEWVHLHNCASRYDERSGGFDIVTGAAADTVYD